MTVSPEDDFFTAKIHSSDESTITSSRPSKNSEAAVFLRPAVVDARSDTQNSYWRGWAKLLSHHQKTSIFF